MGNSVNTIGGGFDPQGNPVTLVPGQRNLSGWGKFVSILGGIAGAIIPGIGGIIAGRAGGQIGGYGQTSGYNVLAEQAREFDRQQAENRAFQAQSQYESQILQQQARRDNNAMLHLQQDQNNQAQQFALVTNLLKSRHDGEMAAVQNLKS